MSVQKWEYKLIQFSNKTDFDSLNDWGEQGWDAVGMVAIHNIPVILFRRPK